MELKILSSIMEYNILLLFNLGIIFYFLSSKKKDKFCPNTLHLVAVDYGVIFPSKNGAETKKYYSVLQFTHGMIFLYIFRIGLSLGERTHWR